MEQTGCAYAVTENNGQTVGFVEKTLDKDVFSFKDKLWSRCNMIAPKQAF